MNDLLQFVLARLKEPSTWRGLVALAAAAGLTVNPEQAHAIVAAGLAVMGVLGTFLPDHPVE